MATVTWTAPPRELSGSARTGYWVMVLDAIGAFCVGDLRKTTNPLPPVFLSPG